MILYFGYWYGLSSKTNMKLAFVLSKAINPEPTFAHLP